MYLRYVKAAREPLSYVGINSVGLRRRGYSAEKITRNSGYLSVFCTKRITIQHKLLKYLKQKWKLLRERDEILQFIKDSQRGIMKGYFQKN